MAELARIEPWCAQPAPGALPPPAEPAGRFFRWRADWNLGIRTMDTDHRRLVALIDRVAAVACPHRHRLLAQPYLSAPWASCPPAPRRCVHRGGLHAVPSPRPDPHQPTLMNWLAVLGTEAKAHFAREETLMRDVDYPDYYEHHVEHRLLLAEYAALKREVGQDVAAADGPALDLEILRAVKVWLLGHMLDDDRRLAKYLHSLGPSVIARRRIQPGSAGPHALPRDRHLAQLHTLSQVLPLRRRTGPASDPSALAGRRPHRAPAPPMLAPPSAD